MIIYSPDKHQGEYGAAALQVKLKAIPRAEQANALGKVQKLLTWMLTSSEERPQEFRLELESHLKSEYLISSNYRDWWKFVYTTEVRSSRSRRQKDLRYALYMRRSRVNGPKVN